MRTHRVTKRRKRRGGVSPSGSGPSAPGCQGLSHRIPSASCASSSPSVMTCHVEATPPSTVSVVQVPVGWTSRTCTKSTAQGADSHVTVLYSPGQFGRRTFSPTGGIGGKVTSLRSSGNSELTLVVRVRLWSRLRMSRKSKSNEVSFRSLDCLRW